MSTPPANASPTRAFLHGLATGVLVSGGLAAAVLYLPAQGDGPELAALLEWTRDNLGLSVLPFSVTLLLFFLSLRQLHRRLRDGSPVHRVAQADQLGDILIGLFFGIGVLWTAIGMRSALLFGLGDGVEAMAGGGAAGLLERLVQGGILTALTTTIVGGAGGYLMRLLKAVSVGGELKRFYGHREQERTQRVEALLQSIRDRLPGDGAKEEPCP